jgi:hypothetical protein
MESEMVSETSVIFNQLTRLIAREDFITPTVHCHVHKSPPLVLILSLMNPIRVSPIYSLRIYFHILARMAQSVKRLRYGLDDHEIEV